MKKKLNKVNISENCFIEIDIAKKAYQNHFGEDICYDELSLLHSTFAYILSNHNNEHNLSNVDIESFTIPNSPFKNKKGEPTDKIYHLEIEDMLHYILSLIISSKDNFLNLYEDGYFAKINEELLLDKMVLLDNVDSMFARVILLLNNKYSKLILNIN
jgi:hypothetical protein